MTRYLPKGYIPMQNIPKTPTYGPRRPETDAFIEAVNEIVEEQRERVRHAFASIDYSGIEMKLAAEYAAKLGHEP